jgi:hypothetical protein
LKLAMFSAVTAGKLIDVVSFAGVY